MNEVTRCPLNETQSDFLSERSKDHRFNYVTTPVSTRMEQHAPVSFDPRLVRPRRLIGHGVQLVQRIHGYDDNAPWESFPASHQRY